MIWISETGKIQNDEDKGGFTGNLTFNSTAGVGTSAIFQGQIIGRHNMRVIKKRQFSSRRNLCFQYIPNTIIEEKDNV